MNHLHFLLSALLCGMGAMTAQAQSVSEDEARQRALEFLNQKTEGDAGTSFKAPRKVVQVGKAYDCGAFYVYNAEGRGGFVIVSGDERAGKILGYSTEGHFDPQQVPANMKAWLEGYEKTIERLEVANDMVDAPLNQPAALGGNRAPQFSSAISPLIKTKWSQDWPYNLQTPEQDGQHCKTGCIATSMAMVMNYWQYPSATAKDIPAWAGLGKVPAGTKIDWGKMSDYYSSFDGFAYYVDAEDTYIQYLYPETTEEQQQAVAALMKMCGMAVQMDYGLFESKAKDIAPLSALKDYFGYKNEMRFLQQDNYTIANWEKIIYHELEQKRPVMYGGLSDDFAFQGGHSFVVDGYDGNGFFHINWGMNAELISGYFTLSAQRFFQQTSAIVGIQPTVGGSIADVPTVGAYTTNAGQLALTAVATDGLVWAIDTYRGCGNIILTLKNNGSQLFKGPIIIRAEDEYGFTAWDNVLAEVPAGGSAQVLVPYYEFQLTYGKNIISVRDYNTGAKCSGEFPVDVERKRIPYLNIEFTLEGVDSKGLITYDTPCTLHYKITSQWGGDPNLKARLRFEYLPSGDDGMRELGHIEFGKTIEGSLKVDAPDWEPLPDYCYFTVEPTVEFYTDAHDNDYLQFYYGETAKQRGESRQIVYCKKKPHFSAEGQKVTIDELTGPNPYTYVELPAGYYVFGHDGFAGFQGQSDKDFTPAYYEANLQQTWRDYLESVTYYTGQLVFGGVTKKHHGLYDCPSDKPYASGSITRTLNGKTVYYPGNMDAMREAASRGLYKNEVSLALPFDEYVVLSYWGGVTYSDDFFDDAYVYYYPLVDSVEGDVNGDDAVDVADIAAIISVMKGGSQQFKAGADVNGDGKVSLADIAEMIKLIANLNKGRR